jgi:glycosyltransferase involved in cell wall biosynthesis
VNVLMMTNTYLPHVGGVARSVASFTEAFRRRGHRVLVVAPTFDPPPEQEEDVLRVPAITNFNNSGFSLRLPVPVVLSSEFERFQPDLVHAHHPFLLGDTALRVAALRNLPLVFTHHTLYEQYTHYWPADSEALKQFAARLATEYANRCDHVIAPSESVAALLRERGVTTPIAVVPTGVDPEQFRRGDGRAARERYGIPQAAFVVGHVGRLAPEKNLGFLARAVAAFLADEPGAHFLVVGSGPSEDEIRAVFAERALADRLHLAGSLQSEELADAYHAMNVFAFASQSETQGMVLAEAMTAGVPVVAVDGPGVREVVQDGHNGRLLPELDERAFAAALGAVARRRDRDCAALVSATRKTAAAFALDRCAERVLEVYEELVARRDRRATDEGLWEQALRLIETEVDLWSTRVGAAVEALGTSL